MTRRKIPEENGALTLILAGAGRRPAAFRD
jgi:hypothetical protein